jgi:predicted PurR-regulated permease PerM
VNLHYMLWWLLIAAAIGALFYLLAPILVPFLFAAIVAYICNPLVDRMARRGVPRTAGAALVLLLLLALFVLVLLIVLPLLHPVAVIFALLAFGQLFGFFGVLFAVPASASLLVWLRHIRTRYLESGMYNA